MFKDKRDKVGVMRNLSSGNGKKTIGIYTVNGYHNYGNRLQLFALTTILKKLGFNTKVFWPKFLNRAKNLFFRSVPILRIKYKKERKLRKFTRRYLPKSSMCRNIDYSVVGSDQVWNPKWLHHSSYLLDITNDSIKVSYAASIGVDTLAEEQKRVFKKSLKNYDAISVREKVAQKLLQPLTDKPIEVVLDPTLLLDENVYESLEKKPNDIGVDEKYVFCYILGGREQTDVVRKFAKENNYKIIMFSDKADSNYGIEEFLYLIHHAELVCTDSFHACVFSFIFERPFIIFRRSGGADYMYSRLQNLVDTFHFQNHEYNGKSITKKNLTADYEGSKRILKKEQKKSLSYLKKALGVNDED